MFKDNKRLSPSDTLIGQGTLSEGKLNCEANLRIEGEHRGDIVCKADVIIGESGIARSTISARDLTVAGKIFGDTSMSGRLIITSSGQLTGSVSASSIIIQEGGQLNGMCHMELSVDSRQRLLTEHDKTNQQAKDSGIKDAKDKTRQAV
ncbi:bactofilin family protein [Paenibacillus luteus]|uniref:bactofilin family protein n=1 Tax=Paenibacillus luteus TaxID=2545753 RepID=UPI001143F0B2|nr:polymer-forming cytoskeletal protein [Paenibacillus luteus]